MKISDLIRELEAIKSKHGDLAVKYQTFSHAWPPEPKIKGEGGYKWVLLNP